MSKRPVGKKGKGKKKQIVQEEISDNLEQEDLGMMDEANMGGMDQLQLTNEEKDEMIFKTLGSGNP